MITKIQEVHCNNMPCVYIAIGIEHYAQSTNRVRLKIGLSRHMGNRRRALRWDSRYKVETIYECPLPNSNKYLESIENDLHTWLHTAPTAIGKEGEEDEVDYYIAKIIITQFPLMAQTVANQYIGGA